MTDDAARMEALGEAAPLSPKRARLASFDNYLNSQPTRHFREWTSNMSDTEHFSPRRQEISSFDRCYAVGVQRRRHSGVIQLILRTGNPLRPFRTTSRAPKRDECIVALIA